MTKVQTIQMGINFEGLIYLLADGLYSTSDIFVRELIQNGHDSIVRRRAKEDGSGYQGNISVTCNLDGHSIVFTDDGVGMDESDIRNFLAVIGSTKTGMKREELQAVFSRELIGQFGIGLLSAFLAAEKVCVRTRKLGTQEAFQWVNTGSVDCELSPIQKDDVGTEVTVFLREGFEYLAEEEKLKELIIRYCDFITVPVSVNGYGPVNAVYAPWDRTFHSIEQERKAYVDFINRRYPDMSMDVFPVSIEKTEDELTYSARGVLFIYNQKIAGNSSGMLDIFVRKMLVKQGDASLLPSWAKFVRGVIDSPDLTSTAGRDNINQENRAFKVIQDELGKVIVERLTYLAQKQPDKFEFISITHNEHLKGMAMVNEEFMDKVADMLLFQTNEESVTLTRYLSKNVQPGEEKIPIYYFTHQDSASQYFRMANEKGICVINASSQCDAKLLESYVKRHPQIELKKINVQGGIFFEKISSEERGKYQKLERALSDFLNRDMTQNVVISTKRFMPAEVPAVLIETETDKTEREIKDMLNSAKLEEDFSEILIELQRRVREKPVQMTLNCDNRLIRMLSEQPNGLYGEDMQNLLITLYNNALLYSHQLGEQQRNKIHDSVVGLMIQVVEVQNQNLRLEKDSEALRSERVAGILQASEARPEHIRLFMMTPFAEEYKPVEDAVRQVFEQAPFYFEVRLARDYYNASKLLDNVKEHIAAAHGFVAEISELNPNVMMEVGGVLLSGDTRPVFALREKNATKNVPADFGGQLTFSYDARTMPAEQIAGQINEQLFTDGRLANTELEKLKKIRKKHFLSHTLLRKASDNLGITLKKEMIVLICEKYMDIEGFLGAEEKELSTIGVNTYMLKAIREELEHMLEKDHER